MTTTRLTEPPKANPITAAIAETVNIQSAADRMFEAVIDVNDPAFDRLYANLCKAAEAFTERAQYLAAKAKRAQAE